MKTYTKPEVEVVEFAVSDVILGDMGGGTIYGGNEEDED